MTRTYTLTFKEYLKELKQASSAQYLRLFTGAKQVTDQTVKIILESEEC